MFPFVKLSIKAFTCLTVGKGCFVPSFAMARFRSFSLLSVFSSSSSNVASALPAFRAANRFCFSFFAVLNLLSRAFSLLLFSRSFLHNATIFSDIMFMRSGVRISRGFATTKSSKFFSVGVQFAFSSTVSSAATVVEMLCASCFVCPRDADYGTVAISAVSCSA